MVTSRKRNNQTTDEAKNKKGDQNVRRRFSDKMWGYVLNQVPEVEGFLDPVVAFNDDPNTRHADVLNVLDAAIEEASRDCPPGRFNSI